MKKANPEAVIYEGVVVGNALMTARETAMQLGFLTAAYNYADHAFEGLTVTTDVVITTLGDYDPNAPDIDEDIRNFVERAHILEVPVAFISDHLKGSALVKPRLGDIWVPYEGQANIELDLRPWLGNIATKVRSQA